MTTRSTMAFLLLSAGCSGGGDKDDNGATDSPTDDTDTDDTDDTDTDVDSADTGPIGDDDDTTPPDSWPMSVKCDATHTLSTLVLNTESDTFYIDLDTASTVDASDPWDFSMSTWEVAAGSGVEVMETNGTYAAFDTLCQAPPISYVLADAMRYWYIYNPKDHTLSPQDRVYFVKSTEGAYFRLRFDGYYEDNDTLHTPGFTFGPVAAPQ